MSRLCLFLAPFLASCGQHEINQKIEVTVENPSNGGHGKRVVELPVPAKYVGWTIKNGSSEWVKNSENEDILLGVVSLAPGSNQHVELVPNDTSVTPKGLPDLAHAELSVRTGGEWQNTVYTADDFSFNEVNSFTALPQLTDHSYYLRYEGPGWESDKMAYRLYLDWRNAIDVFAKTNEEVILPEVGQDGYDSYHELSSWGGDALKVGKSLGLGALGRLTEDGVLHFQYVDETHYALASNTLLRAAFDVHYTEWALNAAGEDSVDVTTHYRIDAYDPTTHIQVTLSEPKNNVVAGLVAHEGMTVIRAQRGNWGVIATWGNQSVLAENDKLGLALFYNLGQVADVIQGEHDYLVRFAPSTAFDYKILALWPQRETIVGDEPVNSAKQFEQYLINKLNMFNYPLVTGN